VDAEADASGGVERSAACDAELGTVGVATSKGSLMATSAGGLMATSASGLMATHAGRPSARQIGPSSLFFCPTIGGHNGPEPISHVDLKSAEGRC